MVPVINTDDLRNECGDDSGGDDTGDDTGDDGSGDDGGSEEDPVGILLISKKIPAPGCQILI